ncbi:MAG: 50S ribosomal protein L29 [Desulfurococcales archaeon]|nr:50S ribosomal protein L29 [Desulfurococcales archaeon]MEB3759004.1 50S ribosomal protein L29 [Desulfurococcales archaeon]MEB3772962.1 50S ribosomal protein L29 [Desulfurococcales archaeon]MEB3798810.1 50S ribosomal protein L29 [Desulfurococcales archaeon]MEB3846132.1 50S ribosomal protein L29 [Desulfurococcales archaeon]
MKIKEIRSMSREERMKKLEELRSELINLRGKVRGGVVENPGKIRVLKRDIARILTVNREEELASKKQ